MPQPKSGNMPPRVKPDMKNALKTLKRIFSYVCINKWILILAVVAIIASALAGVLGTLCMSKAVSVLSNAAELEKAARELLASGMTEVANLNAVRDALPDFFAYIYIMAGIYTVGIIANVGYQYIMAWITTRALRKLRDDMFTNIQRLPLSYFDSRTHGEIMSSFSNDTDTFRELISQSVPQLINSLVSIIGVIVCMLVLSPILTAIAACIICLMTVLVLFFSRKIGKYFVAQQAALAKIDGYIEEYIEGQKVVQVFCHERQVNEGFEKINGEWHVAATKANTFANILMPIMANMSHLNYCVVTVVGSLFIMNGLFSLDIGKLTGVMQYTRQAGNPITQVSQQFNAILTALAGAERIFAIIDEKCETDDGYVKLVRAEIAEDGTITETERRTGQWAWKHPHRAEGTVTYKKLEGEVQFDDVTFSYDGRKTVLKDLTFTAKPGQKFAFVGSTGAGKTTITNLINRFYDVPDGKIRYDGININKIKKDDLRRSLGMVLQDTHLFTGTVRDNIRYGKLDATDEEVENAARLANAHSFIMHLPKGYDTPIEADGANLSQGQRQLLAIARAAVADPPVLILDEATSSIDTRTEKLVEKGMDNLMKGRTVFVIAHRLSTVRNSDNIIVLEHGEIIEEGSHNELIAKGGKYYQLYTGAFELS